MKTRYQQQFAEAFRSALLSLTGEQRNFLRLHMVAGLGIDQLGPMFHVHRSTMARRLQSARDAVLQETTRLLRERLGLSDSQVRSLARVLRSQVDVSLSAVLAQEQPGP